MNRTVGRPTRRQPNIGALSSTNYDERGEGAANRTEFARPSCERPLSGHGAQVFCVFHFERIISLPPVLVRAIHRKLLNSCTC